jgi:hypothetical protein
MLGGLVRFILFRVLGARMMVGIALFEWLRRTLAGRWAAPPPRGVHRAPGRTKEQR